MGVHNSEELFQSLFDRKIKPEIVTKVSQEDDQNMTDGWHDIGNILAVFRLPQNFNGEPMSKCVEICLSSSMSRAILGFFTGGF